MQIIWRYVVPSALLAACYSICLWIAFNDKSETLQRQITFWVLFVVSELMIIWLVIIEILQMKSKGLKKYVCIAQNWIDIIGLGSTFVVLVLLP